MRQPINVKAGYPFGAKPYPLRIVNPDGSVLGWVHGGQDYPAKVGTPVVAPHAGKVTLSAKNGSAGEEVRIESGAYQTRLLHLSRRDVKVGQTVKEGQQVGLSGNTGFSTGPHLHWYLSVNGKYKNPLLYVTPPKPTAVYYIVKKGDTMGKIATAHKTTLTKLKQLNPTIKDLNKISIGQKIRVR